ncbi:MAG: DNA-directed RNA polymerase subunit A' [Thermoplasmata archaeon]
MKIEISKGIKELKFALLSPEEIRRMSAVKVITPDTYDDDGYPIEKGLMDPAMGVIEPGLKCKTCGGKVDQCPGHFGHIELAMPVVHIGFIKEIYSILSSTCANCGRIKLTDEKIKEYFDRIKEVESGFSEIEYDDIVSEAESDASEVVICPHCHFENKKVILDKPTTFREEGKKLTPKEIRERFEKIPNEDLPLLGLDPKVARPEWMILTVFPVPPVNVRPTITLETGERSEDDLTHKLVDVIRINQRLRENRDQGSPQLIIEDLWDLLQYHVTTYFDNQTPGTPPARHRSGRSLKTLVQRLKGKEGRFRSNLSGKRVNFSARTVISPEPFLSINQVGVPIKAARELTVTETVTEHNIEKLKALVANGPGDDSDSIYRPGVNYVYRKDGSRIKITEKNFQEVAEKLEVGWQVERQLQDGDIVLFNRQPSLHRMSMMAHEVKVLPYRTFRFNLAVCAPYNADFDGDEMNLHVLQSQEARAEAEILMKVQENFLSPRFGGPIMGAIHDHITALFILTFRNPLIPLDQAIHILSYVDVPKMPEVIEVDGKKYMRGRDIFSTILPEGVNIEFKGKLSDKSLDPEGTEGVVRIENGKLLSGAIDENAIGQSKGALLDYVIRKYGNSEAARFLDNLTRLAAGVISYIGFSTGIDDEDVPSEAKAQLRQVGNEAVEKVEKLIDNYRNGLIGMEPGKTLEDTLESMIMKVLSQAREKSSEIASHYLGMDNSTVIMARSGARANMMNLAQMAGIIGQQSIRGQRQHRGYTNRTLPHFKKGDLGAYARGFVSSSYKEGLSPTEYFFHATGGREGLVDIAVRTSRSGYMQRRLINALEDLKVAEDGKVLDTEDSVIQLRYGEDGTDPSRSVAGESVDIDFLIKEMFGKKYEVKQ